VRRLRAAAQRKGERMEGIPEGTGQPRPRMSRRNMLLLAIAFAIIAVYLVFRLVQGVLWLTGHL